jgi:ribosome-associated protein
LSQIAIDQKAFDVAIFDMRVLADYTDLFVLCTARNRRHVAAVAEALRLHAKKELELGALGIEGLPSARWVLLDFGTVVVHVFDEPMRGFYNLDGLWSDAPRLHVPESAPSYGGTADEDEEDLDEVELSG